MSDFANKLPADNASNSDEDTDMDEEIPENLMPVQSSIEDDNSIEFDDTCSESDLILDAPPSKSNSPQPECSNNLKGRYNAEVLTRKDLDTTSDKLFTEDKGPQMYDVTGCLVTEPIITKNLPKAFECYLPIFGKPEENSTLNDYYKNKVREFVGCDLNDDEYNKLEDFCSPELLKTGNEFEMTTKVPVMGEVADNILPNNDWSDIEETDGPPNLCILKKNKMRNAKDPSRIFTKKLKYRGVRILPFVKEIYDVTPAPAPGGPDVDLEPGKDVLYRVRVYRPYTYSLVRDRFTRTRHSVFCCDFLMTGRHKLTELRDRFVCQNDFDMRIDISNNPSKLPTTTAKDLFPSGFMFINNVFYVDTRKGCRDYSEVIRQWAIKRKIGKFPKRDMCNVTFGELVLKLGYPEVYVHQGNCEHVFLFSEVRLLNASDPLRYSDYPCSTVVAQNQTTYCTTCSEYSAKWIVVDCPTVPFDPNFFCETCFYQYLYKDEKKVGDFKAYCYRGNMMYVHKHQ